MKLSDLLPESGLPHTGYPESCERFWFGMDTPDAYRRNGGHAIYGETDVVYRFNDHGYRCGSFQERERDDVCLLAAGCSAVFGVGVPEHELFHHHLARRMAGALNRSARVWNLGVSGTSNDAIVRLLHQAVPVLRPDLIVVLFTNLGRREYVTAHNRYVSYTPMAQPTEPVGRDIASHFASLTSLYDDSLNLFRNYKAAEALLQTREWYFSFVKPDEASLVHAQLDARRRAGRHVWLDKARDHVHPGPLTHRNLADSFWSVLERNDGVAALRRAAHRGDEYGGAERCASA